MSKPITCITNPLVLRASRRRVLQGLAGGAVTAALLTAGWTLDAAASPAAMYTMDGAGSGVVEEPNNIVLLFAHPEDRKAFDDHYLNTHVPMALQMPLLHRLEECSAIMDTEGNLPSFYRITTLCYANYHELAESVGSQEGIAAFADMSDFATGGVTATIVRDIKTPHPTPLQYGPRTWASQHPLDPRTE